MRLGRLPLLATLLGALVLAGAGCSPTDVNRSDTIGTNEQVGHMLVRNAHVIAPDDPIYRPGDDTVVRFSLHNRSDRPDALVGARSDAAREVRLRWDRECDGEHEVVTRIPILAEGIVPDAAGERPSGTPYYLEVGGLTEVIRPGTTLPVTFEFERAGEVQVDALVRVPGDRAVPPPPPC